MLLGRFYMQMETLCIGGDDDAVSEENVVSIPIPSQYRGNFGSVQFGYLPLLYTKCISSKCSKPSQSLIVVV